MLRFVARAIVLTVGLGPEAVAADAPMPLAHQNQPTIIASDVCADGTTHQALPRPRLAPKLIKTLSLDDFGTGTAWSPDGTILVTSEKFDSVIKLWRAQDWRLLHTITKKNRGSNEQRFTPDSKYLVTSTTDLSAGQSALSLIDVQSGEVVRQIDGPTPLSQAYGYRIPQHFEFNETGSRLYAGFLARTPPSSIFVYDTKNWQIIDRISTPRNTTKVFESGPRGGLLTTADLDGNVVIWDVGAKKVQVQFTATSAWDWQISLSRNKCLLAEGQRSEGNSLNLETHVYERNGDPQSIQLWDLRTGRKVAAGGTFSAVQDVAISPDGEIVASLDASVVVLYRATDMTVLTKLHKFSRGGAWSISFSANGKLLAAAGDDEVLIYSLE